MDLATMRERVLTKLGLRDSTDIDQADLDVELNRVWRYAIPNRVEMAGVRQMLAFSTQVGVDAYDIDGAGVFAKPIRALEEPFVRTGDVELDLYSVPLLFWRDFSLTGTQTGAPTALLLVGRMMTLRPTPDAVYSIYASAIRYRDELVSAGISDGDEADTVVNGAVAHLAEENGFDEIATRYGALYETSIANLSRKYAANAQAPPAEVQPF